MIILLIVICFSVSLLLTHLVRRHAIAKALFDMPNERSSHTMPTPRGGGLAFVVTFLGSTLVLYALHLIPLALMCALIGGGILVAGVGFCDDRKSVGAKWRFLVHLVAAVWVLAWLGGFSYLDFGVIQYYAPVLGSVLALIAIIWSINLYNFMDGIDGFAGGQGVFLSLVAGLFFLYLGDRGLAALSFALAAAIGGFLSWNWPPAKIFMGDIGSGFLGFVFIVIAINALNKQEGSLVFWLVLFAAFLYDATLTLIYRVAKKQAWYLAHREHAYQQCVDAGWSHKKMTFCLLGLNGALLLPMAVWFIHDPKISFWAWGFVSLCLVSLWIKARQFKKSHGMTCSKE